MHDLGPICCPPGPAVSVPHRGRGWGLRRRGWDGQKGASTVSYVAERLQGDRQQSDTPARELQR